MLEVRLFGTLAIACDGKPVTLSSRAAQSLFAYLILTAGTSHRREKLAGMFWPDTTEEKARASLRYELWRIRKAFPSSEFLLSNDLGIAFIGSAEHWLDVEVLLRPTNPDSTVEVMAALSAYQGELLPGFYDEWVILEREHLQAVFEQKMTRLLDLLEGEKRWHEMVEWAERWIILGHGPEAAYRALLSAYTALGDHAKVASTYERCVNVLAELGLAPSEETRAYGKKRASKINIPIPLTSFIGRGNELKEVADLISKSRLVTLTGSGGIGKTRLAIQVVADVLGLFPDGVWFLDLAPFSDPAFVPDALAGALELRLMGGPNLLVIDQITAHLHSRRALVILDNCEHLVECCAQLVHSLLTACENLSVLATSREALRVAGEMPYRVPSLALPRWDLEPGVDALAKTESVRLFVERAAVISTGFVLNRENALTIAQICKRLDGIPLAIELAAARVSMLTVDQILSRLDDRFILLTGGLRSALPRHRTLRATIEWSYDLLSEEERLLFQRLAVFVGGWTLEAAEAVCSGGGIEASEVLDLLSQLVDKSLVLAETTSDGARYRRLETIRQFAFEKFAASSEGERIHARHLEYFLKLAQKAELERQSEEIIEWVRKLQDEHENLNAALEWSLYRNVSVGQQLAIALCWWWSASDYLIEGYEWLEKMLAVGSKDKSPIRAKLLAGSGWLAETLSYHKQARTFAEKSLFMYRELEDKEGTAFALSLLGRVAFACSDYDQAETLFQESNILYKEAGNKPGIVRNLHGLGYVAEAQGKLEKAGKFYEESLMISKELGDQNKYSGALYFMGNSVAMQGNDARAMELYEEALRIQRKAKNRNLTTWILNEMGMVSIRSGDYKRAEQFLEEGLEMGRMTGKPADIAYSLHGLGIVARLERDLIRARCLYSESLRLVQPLHLEDDVNMAEYLIGVGLVMAAEGFFEKFALMLGMAEGVAPHIQRLLGRSLGIETEELIDLARASLGEEDYTAAWEAGHRMSLREGTAYALRELQ